AMSCSACPVNTFSAVGASSCRACPGATTSSLVPDAMSCSTCPANTFSAAGASSCTACPAGSTSPQVSSERTCPDCLAGTYSGAGATSCTKCPAHTFSKSGASSCTACPNGGTSEPASFTLSSQLTAKLIINLQGSSKCAVACPAGSFKQNRHCKTCPAGTFSFGPDSPSCADCPSDTYSDSGATTCKSCDTGYGCEARSAPGQCKRKPGCPPGQALSAHGCDVLACPRDHKLCPIYGSKQLECIDIQSSLESCGGCVGVGVDRDTDGQDCSAIKNVDDARCRNGRCEVLKCRANYEVSLTEDSCV
ncbi:hypothetical protein C8R47DRAFT_928411, partial [Mycena vitilis]